MRWEGVGRIKPAQDRVHWRAVVKTIITVRVPQRRAILLPADNDKPLNMAFVTPQLFTAHHPAYTYRKQK
jgi:hypothetical protein